MMEETKMDKEEKTEDEYLDLTEGDSRKSPEKIDAGFGSFEFPKLEAPKMEMPDFEMPRLDMGIEDNKNPIESESEDED